VASALGALGALDADGAEEADGEATLAEESGEAGAGTGAGAGDGGGGAGELDRQPPIKNRTPNERLELRTPRELCRGIRRPGNLLPPIDLAIDPGDWDVPR
jgi:hypothetical protein